LPLVPKAGAQCGNSARWDLCGGPLARAVPTATGVFYRSALYPLLERINAYLLRWVRRKYKRLRGKKKARTAWNKAVRKRPGAFAHWAWVTHAPTVW
jgi:RNA-directed DNA polymerase